MMSYSKIKMAAINEDSVMVRRRSGDVENNWIIVRYDTAPYGAVVVSKPDTIKDNKWLTKVVDLDIFLSDNPNLGDD